MNRHGFATRFRCEVLGGSDSGQHKLVKRETGLGRESEQLADEVRLGDRISFGQPSHSPLPDHVHRLDIASSQNFATKPDRASYGRRRLFWDHMATFEFEETWPVYNGFLLNGFPLALHGVRILSPVAASNSVQ